LSHHPGESIKLRGHHLICLQFFTGEGYSAGYVSNLRDVLKRAETGEEIEVCSGTDDICTPCPHREGDSCIYSRDAETEIKEMDRKAIELLELEVPMKVTWLAIKKKIPEVLYEWSLSYCKKCNWRPVCEAYIRTSGYRRI